MASLHETTLFVVVVNIVDDDCMNTVALEPKFWSVRLIVVVVCQSFNGHLTVI